MANFKANEQVLRRLTEEDRRALLSLYQHRCLDEPLLHKYFYSGVDRRRAYTTKRLQELLFFWLIEEVDYGEEFPALFLTSLGVKTVLALFGDTLRDALSFGDGAVVMPTASELSIRPQNIPHQMALNSFILEMEESFRQRGGFRYFDEKHMPPASLFMMPDGVVELPGCYLFLEMDMGTERPSYLARKWNGYRMFLNSPSFFYEEKPVVMLFIISGVKNPELRKKNVSATLLEHLHPYLNGRFEAVIDTPENLHEFVKTQFLSLQTETAEVGDEVLGNLRSIHGFVPSSPSFLSGMEYPYGFYARRLTEQKKVLVSDGRPQEFLVDVWLDGRLSVLRTILSEEQAARQTRAAVGRAIPHLVVAPDERAAAQALRVIGTAQPKNMFFTTPARLSACSWAEALFTIDQLGNLSHFAGDSLVEAVHECRLPKYFR